MLCVRFLCALMCLAALGCSESDGLGETENPVMADGGGSNGRHDDSTDPAVGLADVGNGTSAMHGDSAVGEADHAVDAGSTLAEPSEPLEPDAGSSVIDPDDDDVNEEGPDDEPMTEPGGAGGNGGAGGTGGNAGASGTGGLVGAVCDLLGGLLCPVGLLCVDGSCQEPSD